MRSRFRVFLQVFFSPKMVFIRKQKHVACATDPVRMRKLYPDLGGANPLVRSRRIDADDMQRFQQFGVGLFVNVDKDAHTHMDLKPRQQILLSVY